MKPPPQRRTPQQPRSPLRLTPGGGEAPEAPRSGWGDLTPEQRAARRREQRARRRRPGQDARMVERLARDVLDRRDRHRRGGDVRPDSYRPLGRNDIDVSEPTGIAAERRLTGDVPRDRVAERLAEDERDLAAALARLGVTQQIDRSNPR